MPEMRFEVEWPDGTSELCYSPSSVIKEYMRPGAVHSLSDFVTLSEQALIQASDRVQQKYGFACSSAMDQLKSIKLNAIKFESYTEPKVLIKNIV